MTFLDLARKRRSVRAYRPDPVEDEKLEQVLEAGRVAPSACNIQPWVFIVVRDPDQRKRLEAVYPRSWFSAAPVVIAVCCDKGAAWVRRKDGKVHGDIDAAIAVDHMTLCATDLGLGTCWVCAFDPDAAREVLGLPPHIEPVAFLPLGYPADQAGVKRRKAIEEIVHKERYGGR